MTNQNKCQIPNFNPYSMKYPIPVQNQFLLDPLPYNIFSEPKKQMLQRYDKVNLKYPLPVQNQFQEGRIIFLQWEVCYPSWESIGHLGCFYNLLIL